MGGSPTGIAFNSGLVKTAPTGHGDPAGYFYVWHRQRVLDLIRKVRDNLNLGPEQQRLLEEAGHVQVQTAK